MRGQSIESLLAYEAKKRPEIQAVIDNMANLTIEDIEKLNTPLPWFKTALKSMKLRHLAEAHANDIWNNTKQGFNPDPKGMVGYWDGEDTFVNVGGSSLLELKAGYPLWFPFQGGVWIDTVFSKSVPQPLRRVTPSQEMTRLEYAALIRARVNSL